MNGYVASVIAWATIGLGGAILDYGQPWTLLGGPLVLGGLGALLAIIFKTIAEDGRKPDDTPPRERP